MSTLRETSYKETKVLLCHSEFKESNLVYYQPWITKKLEDDKNINESCKDTKSYIKINEISRAAILNLLLKLLCLQKYLNHDSKQ